MCVCVCIHSGGALSGGLYGRVCPQEFACIGGLQDDDAMHYSAVCLSLSRSLSRLRARSLSLSLARSFSLTHSLSLLRSLLRSISLCLSFSLSLSLSLSPSLPPCLCGICEIIVEFHFFFSTNKHMQMSHVTHT